MIQKGTGTRIERPILAEPSQLDSALNFIAATAPAALGAVVLAGIAEVGMRIDSNLNADIINTLKQDWSWTRIFTSGHAMTVLWQDHEIIYDACVAGIGAVWAASKFNSYSRERV